MPKRILITTGDPAGIGPYLTINALRILGESQARFVIIGDAGILRKIKGYREVASFAEIIDLRNAKQVKPGSPSRFSGKASLEYLREAVRILKADNKCSLVTAPISKEMVARSLPGFLGHTEFLAKEFKAEDFAMMMVGKKINVVFLTRHILLRRVSEELSLNNIKSTLRVSALGLRNLFKIKNPKIALCSFNPHAGLDTYLEREEELLLEAKNSLKSGLADFIGPYPSDTLFKQALKSEFDLVVAFYHDQGMIPFKALEFSCGVNLTLGLAFIRTSPAHGTAFNLVNKQKLIDCRPHG